MKIFFRLLFAHLLADFVLQTNFIANWKKRSFYGVLVHSLTFFILSLLLTYNYITKIWIDYPLQISGIFCLIILFILHIAEDEYRAYNIRHHYVKDNILYFFLDQIIHIALLFIFSPHSSELENNIEWIFVILCLLIVGTYVLSIVILYVDSLVYSTSVAYNFFQKKIYSIIFRFVVMLFFFLPNKLYLLSFLLIPALLLINKKINFLSLVGFWVSTLSVYSIGFVIMFLYRNYIL